MEENKLIRSVLDDVKRERKVDHEEIKRLKSQAESLREELEGAVSDIHDLKTTIQGDIIRLKYDYRIITVVFSNRNRIMWLWESSLTDNFYNHY